MSDPLTLVQTAYAAFGRGDVPAILALLTSDVSFEFRGDARAPYTGTVRGTAQVGEWFGAVAGADDIQVFEPLQFLAGADHVTVIGHERTRALPGGGIFESPWVHVWRVREGKITSLFGIYDTEAAAKARAGA